MKFKINESKEQTLFEGKKITFMPVFDDGNGNWVNDSGVNVGDLIATGDTVRAEMDPAAKGKVDATKVNPNHYIPKADWDRMSNDDSEFLDTKDKVDSEDSWSKNRANQKPKPGTQRDVWKNTGEIHYENDDESDGGMLYQICVAPKESPNFGKGRWVSFDEGIF